MLRNTRFTAGPARVLLVLSLMALSSSDSYSEVQTSDIFRTYKAGVLQIQVQEKNSKTKDSAGSAFFVSPDLAITNYHVIAKLIWEREDYTGTAIISDGRTQAISVVAIDVMHDVALVHVPGGGAPIFRWSDRVPPKGTRLYALGNPFDLGMTIVEGTYSGALEQSLFGRLHFTGAINPGMSGGPVIDASGRVVGVCVASAGNQVGFLVPFQHGKELLDRPRNEVSPEALQKIVGAQIISQQDVIRDKILARPPDMVALGPFRVPGKPVSGFDCWAKTESKKEDRHVTIHSQCETTDDIFVDKNMRTAKYSIVHHGIQNKRLNGFQRMALAQSKSQTEWSSQLANRMTVQEGTGEDRTSYSCEASFVKAGEVDMKGRLCLRAYKEIPGLYDTVWNGVSMMKESAWSLTSTIRMTGVTPDQSKKILKHFLDSYQWKPN